MNHRTKVSKGVPPSVREYLNLNATDDIVWYLGLDEASERCCIVFGRHPKSKPPVETPKDDYKRKIEPKPHVHDFS